MQFVGIMTQLWGEINTVNCRYNHWKKFVYKAGESNEYRIDLINSHCHAHKRV